MYCLECGTKVESGEESCPNCGLTVAAMRERIAQAEEMLIYADTVGPDSTSKLPPVRQRSYVDANGNPLDLAQEVEVEDHLAGPGLQDLPTIGDEGDLYVTMPIQRIVDDHANIVADADTEAKFYTQPEVKRFDPVPLLIASNVVLLLIVVALLVKLFA